MQYIGTSNDGDTDDETGAKCWDGRVQTRLSEKISASSNVQINYGRMALCVQVRASQGYHYTSDERTSQTVIESYVKVTITVTKMTTEKAMIQ